MRRPLSLLVFLLLLLWQPAPLAAQSAAPIAPGVSEWAVLTDDATLLQAFAISRDYSPSWYAMYGQYVTAPILALRAEWGLLPTEVGGMHSAFTKRITMNQLLRGEPIGVVAAILTHEATHAVRLPYGGPWGEACVDEEVIAFSWEAALWEQLPHSLKGTTVRAQRETAVWQLWRSGGLDAFVRSEYRMHCALG